MKFAGIIPARFASTRLPGKALAMIGDRPMIVHVLDKARLSVLGDHVFVATDDQRIAGVVEEYGGKVILTHSAHASGTDRCHEAMHKIHGEPDFVINIQGDEPFIDPEQINALAGACTRDTQIATLIQQITKTESLVDPNIVKVVRAADGKALYFSRSPVPYARNAEAGKWLETTRYWKHIGMYAYRSDILNVIHGLPQGTLEKTESLEQLRWLENNLTIDTTVVEGSTLGIDTPEDLEKARDLWLKTHP